MQSRFPNAFPSAAWWGAVSALALLAAARAEQRAYEPAGPSTRRSGLTFSEIMYHPTNRTDLRNGEFI